MFGGHIWELVVVLLVALVIFGPKRLPEIGGATGKAIREFKRGTTEALEDKPAQIQTPPVAEPPVGAVPPAPPVQEASTPSQEKSAS
ncbi:MAG TPA: twin-arginine translocase TatA/TatE family subunit [Chloroflexota bacterium]|nr:twin-arginine translocase TatA/TatE family subunit [Chloroflexota bacterium]